MGTEPYVCADGTVCVTPEPIGDGLFQVQENCGDEVYGWDRWHTVKRFKTLKEAEDYSAMTASYGGMRIFVEPREC